jgi:hypothetical protein
VAFLLARLAEDEHVARAAAQAGGDARLDSAEAAAEHIVRHDPARVLREVAALRAIALDPATPPAVLLRLASVHELHPAHHPGWPKFTSPRTDPRLRSPST